MSKQKDKATVDDPQLENELSTEDEVPESEQDTDNQADTDNDQVEKLRQEAGELRDKYLRLMAEFENFRKRNVRERMELMDTASKDTLSALLPVLDDFDRMQKLPAEQQQGESYREGVQLVYQKLTGILKQRGLESMDTNGQDFDPELHEALTEIPAPTEDLKGKVVDTIERGYTLKGKIIRHAKVVTGK